jgi:hypothetical protein
VSKRARAARYIACHCRDGAWPGLSSSARVNSASAPGQSHSKRNFTKAIEACASASPSSSSSARRAAVRAASITMLPVEARKLTASSEQQSARPEYARAYCGSAATARSNSWRALRSASPVRLFRK